MGVNGPAALEPTPGFPAPGLEKWRWPRMNTARPFLAAEFDLD